MDHSFCFEIDPDKAAQIVGSMAKTIQMNWRVLAHEAGMSRVEVGDYRSAFEHGEAKYAARAVAPTVVAPSLEPQAADTAKGGNTMQRQPRKDIAAATPQAQSDNVADGFDPSP
ncbi:hypothetical protein [Verminephrobacter aporrectodeae]|uniref:hypothetical protein n=1 Tax=Verminephrobacter aporrectodeae TaxID=1110389 RepID=UPI002236F846|nr:hypothetical protein [Verminephrobacter aporrectodeae]